jgi:hypothetical protein
MNAVTEYYGYVLGFLHSTSLLPPYRREWLGTCWLLKLPNPSALRGWQDANANREKPNAA